LTKAKKPLLPLRSARQLFIESSHRPCTRTEEDAAAGVAPRDGIFDPNADSVIFFLRG
jgi:hypothetical protein